MKTKEASLSSVQSGDRGRLHHEVFFWKSKAPGPGSCGSCRSCGQKPGICGQAPLP